MDLNYVLSKSEKRVSQLHPVVAAKTRELIRLCHREGINIVITQGLRTLEEQAELYAQGRTKPGKIVTNAKPGYSFHCYGVAVDYALLADDGYNVLWTVNDKWRRVAAIAKSLGFAWGGDWKGFVDYPHLEMTFGLSINDYLSGKRPEVKEEEYMIKKEDAEQIIAILSDYWFRMDGNKAVQDYTHYLANEVRKASGQEVVQ